VLVMIHGPGLDRFIEAQVEDLGRHLGIDREVA
jgi:hypothetical protein